METEERRQHCNHCCWTGYVNTIPACPNCGGPIKPVGTAYEELEIEAMEYLTSLLAD